jgi:tetratricopeptide (TPR) repeat protein
MKRESLVFALTGILFGLMVGWIIGSQQGSRVIRAPQQATTTAPMAGSGQATLLDDNKVRALETMAAQRPQDAAVRAQLGNMYFDAERYADAIKWYEQAIALDPKDVNVSTDLGVSYYYTNQADRAVAQLSKSLDVDPKHTKTLLNLGIVRAFGKQDLEGAAESWRRVIEIAPNSDEGRAARQALDSMQSAHPGMGAAKTGATSGAK